MAKPQDLSAEEMRVQAMLRFQQQQELASDTSARWFVPDERFKDYIFTRLGSRTDPVSRDQIELRISQWQADGWDLAPAGTRCSRYPRDGANGVYMMCHPELRGEQKRAKALRLAAEIARVSAQFGASLQDHFAHRTGGRAQVNIPTPGAVQQTDNRLAQAR